MRREKWEHALSDCYLFTGADPQSILALTAASHVLTSPTGKTLFQTGDAANGLHIVLSGLVRIWIADSDGRELTLALLEAGDPFGEIALLDGLPRTANATVVERSECLVLPCRAMETVLARDPALARHLIQLLCELLRRNTQTIGGFAFSGLGGRLALKLYELALSYGKLESNNARMTRRFSQSDLASMLGVTREAVNKRMAALAHDRLVFVEDGYIVVPDLAALAARANTEAQLGA